MAKSVLFVRVDEDLSEAIERERLAHSKRGAPLSRSDVVRMLLWAALEPSAPRRRRRTNA